MVDRFSKEWLPKSDDEIRSAARQMLNDYRSKAKIRDMLYEWLDLKNWRTYQGRRSLSRIYA